MQEKLEIAKPEEIDLVWESNLIARNFLVKTLSAVLDSVI